MLCVLLNIIIFASVECFVHVIDVSIFERLLFVVNSGPGIQVLRRGKMMGLIIIHFNQSSNLVSFFPSVGTYLPTYLPSMYSFRRRLNVSL